MHVCLSLLNIWVKCVTFVPLTSMSHGYSYFFSHKYLLKSSQNVTAMIITQAILGLVSIISMVAISSELYQTYFQEAFGIYRIPSKLQIPFFVAGVQSEQ